MHRIRLDTMYRYRIFCDVGTTIIIKRTLYTIYSVTRKLHCISKAPGKKLFAQFTIFEMFSDYFYVFSNDLKDIRLLKLSEKRPS